MQPKSLWREEPTIWRHRLGQTLSRGVKGALREAALLCGTSVVLRGLGVIRGTIVARLLLPADYGVLATILIAGYYLQALEMGVGFGTIREIPMLRGQQKSDRIVNVEREVFWWEVGIGLVIGALVTLYLLGESSPTLRPALPWLLLPVYVSVELMRNILQCFLQGREEFARFRRSMLWHGLTDLVLGVTLASIWGLVGAMVALTLTSVVMVAYLLWDARETRLWLPARLRVTTFRRLIGAGFPLMLQTLLWTNMTTIDKVIVLSFLTTETLAYYTMAQTVAASLLIVSGAVMRVEGPAIIRRYGETGDPTTLHSRVMRAWLLLSYGQPLLLGAIWLVGPIFFDVVLPRYTTSAPLLDVMGGTFYAMGTALGGSYLYVALGRQVLNGAFLVAGVLLSAGLSVALLSAGFGAMAVATATAASALFYLVALVACGLRMVGRRGRWFVADMKQIMLPFAVCGMLAVALWGAPQFGIDRLWVSLLSVTATAALAVRGLSLWLRMGATVT